MNPSGMVRRRPLLSFRPIVSRFLVSILGCLGPSSVRAACLAPSAVHTDGLTETQAVARALANSNLAELRAGLVERASAEGLARTTWQNPSLQYIREQLLVGGPLGEDYVTLSQTFDVSGRRRLYREAASKRSEAAEHHADVVVADLAALTRHRYYRLLVAQERMVVLRRWRARVEAQLASSRRREKAGDASAYERLRLQRELTRIDAFVQREEATASAAWVRLHALVEPQSAARPTSAPPPLEGHLLPVALTSTPPEVDRVLVAPEFRAADAEARAVALDRRAASRWWIPSPNVGAGYKGVELPDGGRAHGFVVNVGIPLPVLDRGQAERVRSSAEARSLEAETLLSKTRARAEVAALYETVSRLTEAAANMQEDEAEDAALIVAAEAAFRGGEIGVMELLDVYRGSAEAGLMFMDLAMSARTASIDLHRRTQEAP